MPRLYVIPQEQPNAFATGRNYNHSAVAVTAGITKLLSPTNCAASWPTSWPTSSTATS